MRLARPEEYAVGHDDGGAAPGLEQAQEQGNEQQLGLLRLDDLLQVPGGGLVVEAARKRRIGEDERVPLGVVPGCRQVDLGQRVPVADVRILHAVQQHVHAADAQHGGVEVVAVEGALVEPAAGLRVLVDAVAVVLDEMLGGRDEEAGGAAGRIADDVVRHGCGHVHHQLDDVARRAELPVLPGGRDLAEHVLVQITLGVAVGHVDVVELVDHVGQHPGRGHHEEGVLHVMGVGGSLARAPRPTHRLDEGEHPVPHCLEHLLRRKLLETRPAQSVLVGGEHRLLDRLAGAGGLVLLARVQLVQPLDEEQVGELLDDRERVRDAAGPHGVPDSVDLGLQLTGDHDSIPSVFIESSNRQDLEVKPIRGCAARWWSPGATTSSDTMVLHDSFGSLHYRVRAGRIGNWTSVTPDGETGRRGDGETGRRGDGETGSDPEALHRPPHPGSVYEFLMSVGAKTHGFPPSRE